MSIGKKIKQMRLSKGVTQEVFANYLNISYQAVSKWENGVGLPEISLLPSISTYFGVTIDDLFELSSDNHLERIENMLQEERELSYQDEVYVKRHLTDLLSDSKYKEKAHGLLAGLYNHKSRSAHDYAFDHAVLALKENPCVKDYHVNLIESKKGVFTDWNYTNHRELCEFYYNFCEENPTYKSGYLYLMDHLIADGRLSEAQNILATFKDKWHDYLYYLYKSLILKAKGEHTLALDTLDEMVKLEEKNWLVFASRGDQYAKMEKYDLAIKDYETAMKIQAKPRYYDGYECMAHIYEITGNYEEALINWEKIVVLLKEEWSITTGEMVDYPLRNIKKLKEKSLTKK